MLPYAKPEVSTFSVGGDTVLEFADAGGGGGNSFKISTSSVRGDLVSDFRGGGGGGGGVSFRTCF